MDVTGVFDKGRHTRRPSVVNVKVTPSDPVVHAEMYDVLNA